MRKVVEMASEYRLPLVWLVENQENGVTGEAGNHLARDYGLPLLVQIPWSPEILMSMDVHEPFDHQIFLPVAEEDLLRQAEAWVSGERWETPAPPAAAPHVFVGDELSPALTPDLGSDLAPDGGVETGYFRPHDHP